MGKLRPREAELLVQEYRDPVTVVPQYLLGIGSRTNEKTGAQRGWLNNLPKMTQLLSSYITTTATSVARRNYQKRSSLKQSKSILSQFWRLKVQNWGVSKVQSFLEALGRICSKVLISLFQAVASNSRNSLACRCISPVSVFICVCLSLCPNFLLLIRIPVILNVGMTLSYLDYICK